MEKMKGTHVPALPRARMMKQAVWILALTALAVARAVAGTDMNTSSSSMTSVTPCACTVPDWTVELGSGAGWSNVRSGQPNQAYTLVPIDLTVSMKIDDVSLDDFLGGFLRGYTEFYFDGEYQQIVHGPENHIEGLQVGPRYNFVQPGWKLIPYIEGGVGFAFADSNPQQGGLGQDFNFSFSVGAGAKYNFTNQWFARLGVEYQHYSNAGLSDPIPNHPIDELGPRLSVGYSF